MRPLTLIFFALPPLVTGQQKPLVLANDKLELTISATGARLNRLVMKEGEPISPIATIGHFLALDGFGAPSAQEAALECRFMARQTVVCLKW